MAIELNNRQKYLWSIFDFAQGRGLEVGPLHNRIVPRENAEVSYLDVFDRETLLVNYTGHEGVDLDLIPEIDFVLTADDRVRSIPEAIGEAPRFDWVMASHVVEHVPDLVGWLDQIGQITHDGGHLVLAVPDRRYCFDVHRPSTTVGQIIQAHDDGDTVPSVRAVYDYTRGHATTNAPELWTGALPGYERRSNTLEHTVEQLQRAREGHYVDSHVWTFTPGTFLEQLVELRELGLAEWAFDDFRPTRPNSHEFYVVLRRLPRTKPWADALFASEPDVGLHRDAYLPDHLADLLALRERAADDARLVQERDEDVARLRRQVADLEARLDAKRDKVHRLRRRLKHARTRAERAESRAEALESSLRWRAGSALARPVGAVRRRIGR